ncbi:MAG: hypothetical protein QUT27_14345 [candidate division Zixibacteria bacterium]|nr:hypothetical protein [candidate division Zixibacteria bacterium]
MASLVEKYFSAADFAAIEAAVRQAESATSGEIAVELASRSRNWSGERLLCALAVTFVCMVAALLATRRVDWGVY